MMQHNPRTYLDDATLNAFQRWWESLNADRASRAMLRRCSGPQEIFFIPTFHVLRHQLSYSYYYSIDPTRLALAAGLSAHVDEDDDSTRVARQFALPREGRPIALSPLRFRRLLSLDRPDEVHRAMVRALRMLKRRANVKDLARAVYAWDEETKRNWAFDYYDAAPESESDDGADKKTKTRKT